jgi:pyrroline-5-carboxylate reductase
VLCTDSGSGRAAALAAELGGEAPASNRELAERADLVILAHKPAQLEEVAGEIAGTAKAIVSLLARTPQADVRGGGDTLALRRAVASPGGTTARGLAALERGGLRAAFAQAMDDVVDA